MTEYHGWYLFRGHLLSGSTTTAPKTTNSSCMSLTYLTFKVLLYAIMYVIADYTFKHRLLVYRDTSDHEVSTTFI